MDVIEKHRMDVDSKIILSVQNLVKYFPITGGLFNRVLGHVHAVDDVSFNIPKGKTIGIVGESGCGKTTLGRLIVRLLDPTSGDIFFSGKKISSLKQRKFRPFRKNIQIVFQDPYASMNPRMTVKNILSEPLRVHKILPKGKINPYILSIMREVGLDMEHLHRFPHEFSGGQRQRICLARSLILNPDLIVLDEPTASVDVSVQARVLNLLKDLQEKRNLTYLFISHDLSVVTFMAESIVVMYLGKIMEFGPKTIFTMDTENVHPYTSALGVALPIPDPFIKREKIILKGDVPSPVYPPPGCVFHTRCPFNDDDRCKTEEPELKEVSPGHFIACHYR
jgi:oligopeptide/dipeptide ABC transporter ATP-binding protein